MTLPSAPAQEIPPASGQLGPFTQLVDSDWLEARAQATDIPRRVLAAYAAAALRVAESYPQCRLGWNTLAGIGATEILHGTYRGSSTAEDGRDLTTDEGWQQAVLAYNRSVAYANQVASSAENYGQAGSQN